MFERLNQPISFRRKPTAEDALETAAPAAQAPASADGESQGRKRSSLLSRLKQPISLRGKSNRQEADATPPAPEQPAVRDTPAVRQARTPAAERPAVTPAAKSEPLVGPAERSVATPGPDARTEPLAGPAERSVATPGPAAKSEPLVGSAEHVFATPRAAVRQAPPERVAPEPRAGSEPVAGTAERVSVPTPTSGQVVASAEPAAPSPEPAVTSAAPEPAGAAPVEAAAPEPAAADASSRASRLGRLNHPVSLGRKSKADAAPATPAPAAAAPARRDRGSRLARLNQPISLAGKSRGAAPSVGAPATARRRGAHVPRRPRRTRNLVGLEIEPGQLVAARSHLDGHVVVERAVGTPLAPNIVRDGEVTDVDALSSALSDLFDGSGLDRRVRIGIANQRIVMRQLELPPILDPKELANAVHFQAQDEIPMPIESVVLDFHALGVVETENGARMRILLVAARRDMVERVLLAARQAGLRPEGVDLAAFGMIRALRPFDLPETDQVLYLSIGGVTNLAIASGSTCEFTRVITTGIDTIVAEVAGRAGVPFPDARRLVSSVSASILGPRPVREPGAGELILPGPSESPDGPSLDHAEFARTALGDGIRRIAAEVRNSLDFHLGAHGGTPIARTVLTGPALDLEGFDQALGRELGMALTRAEVALATPSASGHVPMSRLAVAAGLSIAEGSR